MRNTPTDVVHIPVVERSRNHTPFHQVQTWELNAWQLPLAQLCDSALPTGAFSHSFGLETYITQAENDGFGIKDEASFGAWLRQMIRMQLTYNDAFAIREIITSLSAPIDSNSDDDAVALVTRVDQHLHASALSEQVREANQSMGKRMVEIALIAAPSPMVEWYRDAIAADNCFGHPAVVVALVGQELGAPVSEVIAAHLQGVATSLTQNAVRAIPLGQNAGQRALTAVRPDIMKAVEKVAELTWLDFGVSAPGLEIAQMRHERIKSRMFRS